MTTLFLRLGELRPKSTFLIFGMLLLGNGAFAQLDSVSVSNVSFSQEIITDSVTNVTDTLDIMSVEVYIDDIDFMGEVLVLVYDQATDFPVSKIKHTKAELNFYNLISGSVATIEVFGLEPIAASYRIDIQVRNFQGGNFPLVSTQY